MKRVRPFHRRLCHCIAKPFCQGRPIIVAAENISQIAMGYIMKSGLKGVYRSCSLWGKMALWTRSEAKTCSFIFPFDLCPCQSARPLRSFSPYVMGFLGSIIDLVLCIIDRTGSRYFLHFSSQTMFGLTLLLKKHILKAVEQIRNWGGVFFESSDAS